MPHEKHIVQLLPEEHVHDILDVRAARNGEKTGEMGSFAHARQCRREHPMTPRSQQRRNAGVAPSAAPSTMHQDKSLIHGMRSCEPSRVRRSFDQAVSTKRPCLISAMATSSTCNPEWSVCESR